MIYRSLMTIIVVIKGGNMTIQNDLYSWAMITLVMSPKLSKEQRFDMMIADSDLLNEICSQIIGRDAGISIDDEGLAGLILQSEYALS